MINTEFWKWFFRTKTIVPILITLITTTLLILSYHTPFDGWWHYWEMPVVFGTFVFSVFIATRSFYEEWNSSLQKRITVHAKFDNQVLMSCYDSYLTSENDIRQWGQQILRQMAVNQDLDFVPWMSMSPLRPVRKGNQNYYTVIFYLRALPTSRDNKPQTDFSKDYYIWIIDEEPGENPKHKEVTVSQRNTPLTKDEAMEECVKQQSSNG